MSTNTDHRPTEEFRISDGPTVTAAIAPHTDADCQCGFPSRGIGWRMVTSARSLDVYRCPECKTYTAVPQSRR